MKKKIVSMILVIIIMLSLPLTSMAASWKTGYHAGPRTLELTSLDCVELNNASSSGNSVTISRGGSAKYGFYLPFEAESITLGYDGKGAPVSVTDGKNTYVIEPDGDKTEVTYKLPSIDRIGEKQYTFSASSSVSLSKIVFNKIQLQMTDYYKDFELPSLSDEEFAVQGAVLINTSASAFLANGSTRYVNADNPAETPKTVNETIYMPAHTLARAFGAYYEEIPEKGYVLLREPLSKGEIMVTPEWSYTEVNGVKTSGDNICFFENGKAYLPVLLTAETFGKRTGVHNGLIAIDDNKYYVHDELYDGKIRGYIDNTLKPFIPTGKQGKTYHVAQTLGASDNNPGTLDAPFKTLNKAGEVALAGDTVIVHAGTYRETLRIKNNGEPTRPIVFKAAEGEEAVISALEVIDGFAEYKNGMYVASFPWDMGDGRNQIFYNGKTLPEAKYPNAPGIDIGPDVEPLSDNWAVVGDLVTDPENNLRVTSETLLNQDEDDYWKDAYFVTLRGYCYALNTARVAGSKNGELSLTDTSKTWWDKGQANHWNWGYLAGHRNAIDIPGEWVMKSNVLFMMPPEGADADTLVVEAKRRQLVADIADNKYVQLRGFTTIGGSMRLNNSEMCVIDNCNIKYNNHYILTQDQHTGYIDDASDRTNSNGAPQRGEVGLYVGGRNNVFTNNIFKEAAAAAIYGVGLYTYIENNIIDSCGYAGSYVAGLNFNGELWMDKNTPRGGHLIVQNSAFNCGRSPLQTTRPAGSNDIWPMVPYEVAYNEFYNGMLASLDTGITYTYFVDHGNSRIKTRMHNNYVYYTQTETNPYSMGIYHDGGTQNIDTYENLIFTTHEGVSFKHDPVFVQPSVAANAICNVWNNSDAGVVEGGRDGLEAKHYPEGVKPFDAGSRLGREPYMLNYNARTLDAEKADNIIRPDSYSDGVKDNGDGSFKITADGQWIKFTNLDINDVSQFKIYFKGDKYKLDKENGSAMIHLDSLESSLMAYKCSGFKVKSSYLEHSLSWVTRDVPMVTGAHDVYIKFTGLTDIDILGITTGTKEVLTGSHKNIIYGGNFDDFMQETVLDSYPTRKYYNTDAVNPMVNNTWNGTTLVFANVEIEEDTNELAASFSTTAPYDGQKVQIRLDSIDREPLAEFETIDTGTWGKWDSEVRIPLSRMLEKGKYTIYVTFTDETGGKSCNFYYIDFAPEPQDETEAAEDAASDKK